MRKIMIRILFVIIVILALIGITFFSSGKIMGDVTQSTTVEVKDGVALDATMEGNIFTVEEDGSYEIYANCQNDKEGLITAFILYDENEKIVFYCTGHEFDVESSELALTAGEYKANLQFITNEEDLLELIKEGKGEYYSEEKYDFAEDETFDVTVTYNLQEEGAMSGYYLLGIICGVAVGIAFVALLACLIRKAGGKVNFECRKDSFDERQLLARGVAYKYAFYTLLIGVLVLECLEDIFKITMFSSLSGVFFVICISLLVFATICIMKDAYMSLYENAKGILMMFLAIALLNIALVVKNILNGVPFIENGTLSSDYLNLIAGLMFVYIIPLFAARVMYNKKQLEEDEE